MPNTKTMKWIAGGAVGAALVAAAAAFGIWYFIIRSDAPPPVNLPDAALAAAADQASDGSGPPVNATAVPDTESDTAATAPAPIEAAAPEQAAEQGQAAEQVVEQPAEQGQAAEQAADPLVGQWAVRVDGSSFAGYRVQEELARIGANTAVGRTPDVTGSLIFDGAAITDVAITVDVTTLESDDSRRDRTLRNRGIETNVFPTATFVLAEPIPIAAIPAEGISLAATAVGDFTLHGVTHRVAIPLEGQIVGDLLAVVGSLEIEFADYDIELPSALSIVSIEDHGVMEFQLIFEQAA